MTNRNIGRVISISSKWFIAELYAEIGNYINTVDGIRFVGEIGSYVSIEEIERKVIAEIISIDEKNIINSEKMSKPNSHRLINLNLIGEISSKKFTFGVSKMPLIFSEVSIITEKDLRTMLEIGNQERVIDDYNNTRLVSLSIGKSVVFPDYDVKINIDRFFGFHFSVFGNTGAGKSNTIARIIQNVFKKEKHSAIGAKFIIIDSNGEYESSICQLNKHNPDIDIRCLTADLNLEDKNHLELPVWALSADDWAVLLHASEKTQIPIIKRAIDIARIFYDPTNSDNSLKNHILSSTIIGILNSSDSSPSKSDKIKAIVTTFGTGEINLDFSISTSTGSKNIRKLLNVNYGQFTDIESLQVYCEQFIIEDVNERLAKSHNIVYDINQFYQAIIFAVLYEGSISSQRIQEYTATLTTRLQALIDSEQGKILSKTKYTNLDDYVLDILGNNQVVNIDISSLDDSSGEVVVKVITKLFFDYLKKMNKKAEMPINLVIEEAHRFVKNDSHSGALSYNIFERVAKEGRKYGLLLGISSQRPSELSKTVVSQCSNFIIHRVQNPDDISYISRMVPYISEGIINRLTYLQTGDALVFGTAINLPTLTRFNEANPPTDGQNAKISEKWYIAKTS
ncbi:ATP-binding protein [Proteiniborus sp. MB09-C3]|uniref:ATP-binding protein n=1 Tax=Proteiniborus sp. MB09-C3 TaxID=3050072 RepID=UPI002555C08F|nr:ATP-binding protein [Proteiniborus sp. MB09-C3]WIV11094.1 ATP-binding protein [Proteiniborus sp. MB09-C3]